MGVSDLHRPLRRDIRELGELLGRALVRQEGPQLFQLVERVRQMIRSEPQATASVLSELDSETATKLVRAFLMYFHLANVAEQVHRGRELAALRACDGSWLAQAVTRISDAGVPAAELAEELARLGVRPVFTAHPTEAARRTVLAKIRDVAGLLDERVLVDGDPVGERRVTRRLEELIDLLWQTDELRIVRPDVLDEARNACTTSTIAPTRRARRSRGPLRRARALGFAPLSTLAPHLRQLDRGDRDGIRRGARGDEQVLDLQHEHGIRSALALIDALRTDLSTSVRSSGSRPSWRRRWPLTSWRCPTSSRAPAPERREPYRLKLTCIGLKLANTRERLADGRAHVPGRDYTVPGARG